MSHEAASIIMAVIAGLGLLISYLTYRVVVIYTRETKKMQEAVSGQSRELTRQINLSIMPAFTIEFIERMDLRSQPIPPREVMFNLELRNVGNGVAINVQIDPLVVNNDPNIFNEKFSDGELIFKWIPSLRPSASERLVSVPNLKDNSRVVDLMRWMQIYSATGKMFDFKLRFQDIEGNWYSQTLKLSRNECTPEPVTAITQSEGEAILSDKANAAPNNSFNPTPR
jgi:hypothetical protein